MSDPGRGEALERLRDELIALFAAQRESLDEARRIVECLLGARAGTVETNRPTVATRAATRPRSSEGEGSSEGEDEADGDEEHPDGQQNA